VGRYGLPSEECERVFRTSRENYERRFERCLADVDLSGVEVASRVLAGPPGVRIPEYATEKDVELIVMGTLGRTGIAGLLIGNTAETILAQVECPVLAVKPEGFVTPVTLE
jgi:nucleotide-binding universal stress UspA family protein